MKRQSANTLLVRLGFPELFVHKAEGVYYLIGDDPRITHPEIERCLHVVRVEDLTKAVIEQKLGELTAPDGAA